MQSYSKPPQTPIISLLLTVVPSPFKIVKERFSRGPVRASDFDVEQEESVESKAFDPLTVGCQIPRKMIEPNGQEGKDGIDWKKPDDADDLLLFPWSSPVRDMRIAQIHTNASSSRAEDGSNNCHEQVEGDFGSCEVRCVVQDPRR